MVHINNHIPKYIHCLMLHGIFPISFRSYLILLSHGGGLESILGLYSIIKPAFLSRADRDAALLGSGLLTEESGVSTL